ncbi:hypothetical protein GCM10027037_17090 [Mucilaginibacter koreensis]
MKRLLLTAILCAAATGVFAQSTATDTSRRVTDTVKIKTDTVSHAKRKVYRFRMGNGITSAPDSSKTVDKAPGFSWGLTFSRFDLGLATLLDNGSFKLSPQNNFLRYRSWKTLNVGFDVLQAGYRFSPAFKVYLSAGFDWTLIRLRENITILEDQPVLTYRQDNIIYSKNRFSSSYLRIPLAFDFRTRGDENGKYVHFVAGPDIGILLNGRVKQKSDENGKQKFNDDYHFAKLRYGVTARVGYGSMGLFAKYYFNDMFQDSPAQEGLKNLSVGLMFGF